MSLVEIIALTKERSLTLAPLQDGKGESMMKQVTWDDQWIGYDDADTIKAKTDYASSRCFIGTTLWSADLEAGSLTDSGQKYNPGQSGILFKQVSNLRCQ